MSASVEASGFDVYNGWVLVFVDSKQWPNHSVHLENIAVVNCCVESNTVQVITVNDGVMEIQFPPDTVADNGAPMAWAMVDQIISYGMDDPPAPAPGPPPVPDPVVLDSYSYGNRKRGRRK